MYIAIQHQNLKYYFLLYISKHIILIIWLTINSTIPHEPELVLEKKRAVYKILYFKFII